MLSLTCLPQAAPVLQDVACKFNFSQCIPRRILSVSCIPREGGLVAYHCTLSFPFLLAQNSSSCQIPPIFALAVGIGSKPRYTSRFVYRKRMKINVFISPYFHHVNTNELFYIENKREEEMLNKRWFFLFITFLSFSFNHNSSGTQVCLGFLPCFGK